MKPKIKDFLSCQVVNFKDKMFLRVDFLCFSI